jgi:hypothetical protein
VLDVVLRRFEKPDEIREFVKGRFEIVRLGGMTIGRATRQPGWRWSVHVGLATGAISCNVSRAGAPMMDRPAFVQFITQRTTQPS